jgi:HPt (histidine-containing phosphotransfer) domain-containing protein
MPGSVHPEIEDSLANLAQDIGEDGVLEIVQLFIDDTPRAAATLRDAFTRGDAEGLHRSAHTLKSTSATVGAWKLSFACMEVERLAKAGDLAACGTHVSAVSTEYAKALKDLELARAHYAPA